MNRYHRPFRAAASLSALLLCACSDLGYYAHLAHGEYALLSARQPIAQLIADPATSAELREHLKLAQAARSFASDKLDLPRNGSYTDYADLGRPAAVWNVFAAPEFSLQPVTHCFLIAGCVAYRGYFDRAAAEAEAQRLQQQGYETNVGSVPAYSTLGWFDDPILNTMLRWGDDALDSGIFHELAHQKLYVKDDTAFNESFASFVEREGLRQWRAARGLPPAQDDGAERSEQFTALVLAARARLQTLYAGALPPAQMRARKAEEIERLRADYRALRDGEWHGDARYDAWMNAQINNAKLLPFGLYHRWVPAFAALYAQQQGSWPAFYAAAKKLAELAPAARARELERLETAKPAAPA